MSTCYEMSFKVSKFDEDKKDTIIEALKKIWPGAEDDILESGEDDDGNKEVSIQVYGCGILTGGQSEDEFAQVVYKEVLKANESICGVEVVATCMEYIPYETYTLDEKEAQEILQELSE